MVSSARAPWPIRSWRRYPFVTVLLVGWLGGGLLSAAVAAAVDYPGDHLYALAHTTGASLALVLLTVLGARTRSAAPTSSRPATREPAPAAVPEPRPPQHAVPVGAVSASR